MFNVEWTTALQLHSTFNILHSTFLVPHFDLSLAHACLLSLGETRNGECSMLNVEWDNRAPTAFNIQHSPFNIPRPPLRPCVRSCSCAVIPSVSEGPGRRAARHPYR